MSRRSVFRLLRCFKPPQGVYESHWSLLCELIRSPTSRRFGGTSKAEKFLSPIEKDFFNSIGHKRKGSQRAKRVRFSPQSQHRCRHHAKSAKGQTQTWRMSHYDKKKPPEGG